MPHLFAKKQQPPDVKVQEEEKPAAAAAPQETTPPDRLLADIERLKAQVDALNQTKDSWSQRFSDISERIGELRSMTAEIEKRSAETEAKAARSAELLENIDMGKIMVEMQKRDAKIDTISAKTESYVALYDAISTEMKGIRSQIGLFRGIDAVVKLSDEVKNDLIAVQKIKTMIEADTDKVENIFLEMKRTMKELVALSGAVTDMQSTLSELRKVTTSHDIRIKAFAEKKDIDGLSASMKSLAVKVDGYAETIGKASSEMDRFVEAADRTKTNVEQLQKEMEGATKYIESLGAMKQLVDRNSARIKEMLGVIEMLTEKVLVKEGKAAGVEESLKQPIGNESAAAKDKQIIGNGDSGQKEAEPKGTLEGTEKNEATQKKKIRLRSWL